MIRVPLRVGSQEVHAPLELAGLVREDAARGGGSIVPEQAPEAWLVGLVSAGDLGRDDAVALAAALLQEGGAAGLAAGARIGMLLGAAELGPVVLAALDVHDVGDLLARDPIEPDRSVEDTLLHAACALADGSDEEVRALLLTRLRHAGLPHLEVPLLCEHGNAEELARWLPAVLSEPLDPELLEHVARYAARDDERGALVRRAADAPSGELAALLRQPQA